MCGIVGFIERGGQRESASSRALVLKMARAIIHRGPDGEGAYVDAECGVALGHRRLSIIDPSEAGAQPMISADGRWIIVLNGEIYNYEEMRRSLVDKFGAVAWRGHSDTEVLVESISRLGFEASLKLANGMFAVAVWDRKDRSLLLARDRMGEKPLYYGWQESTFLFGSELKALCEHDAFRRRINPDAVSQYVAYRYVPSPLSIYQGIAQLEPACFVRLSATADPGTAPAKTVYWTLPSPAPQRMEEREAADELDFLLRDAIRIRMRADVPMGAFLSGGIDSSTIVSLMQAQSDSSVRSFSIGFRENDFDESPFASEISRHLGTSHTQMHVTTDLALETVHALPRLYDEPFGDSSQIPTYLLSKLTREHVKVCLSGDGGDELFGGYHRYFELERRWSKRLRAADFLRPSMESLLLATPEAVWRALGGIAPRQLQSRLQPYRLRRLAQILGSRNPRDLYLLQMQAWAPFMLERPLAGPGASSYDRFDIAEFASPFLGVMFLDAIGYLPDDILVKLDRASMAASLETRVPFLDHRIAEFASRLPLELKRQGDKGKWLLRKTLDRYVPPSMVDRPKQGFAIPAAKWLRGGLRGWAEDLLMEDGSIIAELVDMKTVREAWRHHRTGDVDESARLWPILMLVAWAREWHPL
jgi:asparagine synthase (glutamine-hydrolysing)